ncbi:MAG: adenosylcobinamide-GDP ribazoletransferase [Eubacteriales bacterium]
MKKFLIALSFFTRIPVHIKSEVSEDEFYTSMTLIPWVGLLIGLILYGVAYGGEYLTIQSEVLSFILLCVYVWITGGLHIDGFIDSIDAILSNRDREKMLDIMKDSRIGAFGAIGIVLLLLGYFIIFKHSTKEVLLVMPMIGRSCALVAASLSHYAKKTNDLGKKFIESIGKKQGILVILFTILVSGLVNIMYIFTYVICLCVSYFFVNLFRNKLSGMTGDTVGMLIEINQVVFLFTTYILVMLLGGVL